MSIIIRISRHCRLDRQSLVQGIRIVVPFNLIVRAG